MLRVTLAFHPFGRPETEPLGDLDIVNVLTGSAHDGNYHVRLRQPSAEGPGEMQERTWSVEGFERDRGAWALVYEALKKVYEP